MLAADSRQPVALVELLHNVVSAVLKFSNFRIIVKWSKDGLYHGCVVCEFVRLPEESMVESLFVMCACMCMVGGGGGGGEQK